MSEGGRRPGGERSCSLGVTQAGPRVGAAFGQQDDGGGNLKRCHRDCPRKKLISRSSLPRTIFSFRYSNALPERSRKESPCAIVGEGDADSMAIIMPMSIVKETYYIEEDIA